MNNVGSSSRSTSIFVAVMMALVLTTITTSRSVVVVSAFQPTGGRRLWHARTTAALPRQPTFLSARRTLTKERPALIVEEEQDEMTMVVDEPTKLSSSPSSLTTLGATTAATAVTVWTAASEQASAAANTVISSGSLDPNSFAPVCSVSDGFYRFLQSATVSLVGEDSFVEYGPLIAGGLLRIRLELCVIESFFNEAVGPFIAQKGISWILPFHETVETFLAGVIFALATTFILIGSSKILNVIATYTDFLLGGPSRLLGGFTFDRALGKPVTLDIGLGPFKTRVVGPPKEEEETKEFNFAEAAPLEIFIIVTSGAVKYFGLAVGVVREVVESVDLFVGRYLVLVASGYVLLKFVHFKIFPDFP